MWKDQLHLVTIVYVMDMKQSYDFYSALGFEGDLPAGELPVWLPMKLGSVPMALHSVSELQPGGQVGIALNTDDLDAVADRLRALGIPIVRPMQDEVFGRSLVIRDPDGLLIQINEH